LVASVKPCQLLRADLSTQQLHAGRYQIIVRDSSRVRFFSIVGPGVRRKTTASFSGKVTWSVRLRAGVYRFRCGAAQKLRGTLVVG
jgi:hypothetical protein